MVVLQFTIELSGKQFESLFARADNEQAVDKFNSRTEELLTTCLQIKTCRRGITTVADKEIQARNEARLLQNTKR